MQQGPTPSRQEPTQGFNPHRPFRAGATGTLLQLLHVLELFQSSPALSGRCNMNLPYWARPFSITFQSSPALSGRCNIGLTAAVFIPILFQSSPALSGRCNSASGKVPGQGSLLVSILTGPFGPVQLAPSPPAPSRWGCFNPHRPFRAGATLGDFPTSPSHSLFQSSPALSGRCNSPLYRSPPDGQEGGPSRRPPSRDPRPGA